MRSRIATLVLFLAATAQANFREFREVPVDPALSAKLQRAAEATLAQYPKLKAEDLAITVVDVTNAAAPSRGDHRGDAPFYPASVIKLFFMNDVYAQHKETLGDVDRALKEMITVSDNDATAYLVDILARTSPGPELQGRALRRFIERRRAINKRYQKLGYEQVSAMMKPWSFGPFGRDRQALGKDRVNRNRLTANETASLMLWIARRRAPSADAQLTLLNRPLDPLRTEENQVKEFIGEALPPGSQLWSKAGWTSEVRHDAAYVELPGGRKLVVVIFTRGQAGDVTLVPAVTRNLLSELQNP
jgi:beta-lactamase class A